MEAGGSKFVCAVGTGPDDLRAVEFPTTTPDETVGRAIQFFLAQPPIAAIGIASFGPIDPNPQSAAFGYITSTPKPAWRNYGFAGAVRQALGVTLAFDTDVNAAALAESRWGAARGIDHFIYVTVGTGIGGGAMSEGRLIHGRSHPEMGHIRVPRDRLHDPFPGNCPFHGDCLEGLAAGPALEARWGCAPHLLPDSHAAWDLEAEYLALGILNWTCTLAPERIILGGGVLQRSGLIGKIERRLGALLHGYMAPPTLVLPALGSRSGVLGAIALAQAACTIRGPAAS